MSAGHYRERYYTSQDGLRLCFRDYGDAAAGGTTALCLGGLTRNAKDFHQLAGRLAARRRVLCPDYRGRGRSQYDPQWRNYQPRTYLDDVRHLLVACNVHRVAVIGTSLGGLLAMGMTAAMPTVLAGAVLNDVGPVVDTAGLERIVSYVRRLASPTDWNDAARQLRHLLPDWPAETDAEWLDMARRTFREDGDRLTCDWDPRIMKPFDEGTGNAPDLWPVFRALGERPVVAVRGERSDILSVATLERMLEVVPHLVAVTIEAVGHAPSLMEPAALEAIDRLFDDVDRANAPTGPA